MFDAEDSLRTGENISVKECLETMKNCSRYNTADGIPELLERLKSEFDKNYDSRIYGVQNEAYDVILKLLTSFDENRKILRLGLKSMIRLTSHRPNLLDEKGIVYQMNSLKSEKNISSLKLVLRWIKQCCFKSEKNRQDIFNAKVIDHLRNILQSKFLDGGKLQDVCSLLRALTLDDDPEFDYGSSVERAREIATDTLVPLTILLDKFRRKKKVVSELLRTLITLLVQNEYCKNVEEAGGANFILEAMRSFPDDENLNCLVLRLIKILTGNHDVKIHLVSLGAVPLIIEAMSRIQTGAIAVAGLNCMAALALGSPRNSIVFYDFGAPGLIIETMKRYPANANVQSYGARAIGSSMGNVKDKIDLETFLERDVEAVLEIAMKIHGDDIEDDIKAAFSSLGLNPELKDHWTKIPVKK